MGVVNYKGCKSLDNACNTQYVDSLCLWVWPLEPIALFNQVSCNNEVLYFTNNCNHEKITILAKPLFESH